MTQINSPIERSQVRFLQGFSHASQLMDWWKQYEQEHQSSAPVGVAMIGRSNVGKSTLINHLFKQDIAQISKTPGKTKKINVFEFVLKSHPTQKFFIFDLPGHGHARVSQEQKQQWEELLSSFFPLAGHTCLGIVIQDARHLQEKSDQSFLSYIYPSPMELVLVANKTDTLKNQKDRHAFERDLLQISRISRWSAVFRCAQSDKEKQLVLANYLASFCLRRLSAQEMVQKNSTT